jgi:signal transduction histidine kinase/FixJ family two-component response regulator
VTDDQAIKILLVEDDEDDYILVRDMLADVDGTHYDLHWVNSYETGLEALGASRYDVCLLDYHLREQDGIGFLHALSGQNHVPPIIFLTGMSNYAVDLGAMRAGAADYLEKTRVNSHILERAIRYAMERQVTQARLRQQSAIMEGINRVLREALNCATEEELGRTSVSVVQELTGAGCGFIKELQPEGHLRTIAIGSETVPGACCLATGTDPATLDRPEIRDLCDSVLREKLPLLTNRPEPSGETPETSGCCASLSSFLGIPLQHAEKVIGLIGLVNKEEGFDQADRDVAETLAPAIVEALMHFRAERQALSLTRLYRLLSMLNEAIVRIQDRQGLLQEVCRIAVQEGLFRLAWIGLMAPSSRTIESAAQCCFDEKFLPKLSVSLEDGPEADTPMGIAIREGKYDICNDIAADPRMAFWQGEGRDLGFRACGAFPLRIGGEIVGALTLYADRPGFFTAEEIALLESLTENLSFALESMDREAKRLQAEEALQETGKKLRSLTLQLMTAQETERKRISMELHDDLGQSLTFLKLQLRDIENNLPPDLWELKQCSAELRSHLNEVIDKVRRISRDLSPSILVNLGLPAALNNLVEDFCKFHECKLSMELDNIKDVFDPEEEISIYRIFQESLNNIAKHAKADQIYITAKSNNGYLNFQVEDNGRGFDIRDIDNNEGKMKGLGLAAIKERMRMLGGRFEIWSQPGQGTKLSCLIPMRRNELDSLHPLPLSNEAHS